MQTEVDFSAVRASNDNVFRGVKLDRTVILTKEYLLDVYRVTADAARTFDWTMHCHGEFSAALAQDQPISLGDALGYRHMTGARQLQGEAGRVASGVSTGRVGGAGDDLAGRGEWLAVDPRERPTLG